MVQNVFNVRIKTVNIVEWPISVNNATVDTIWHWVMNVRYVNIHVRNVMKLENVYLVSTLILNTRTQMSHVMSANWWIVYNVILMTSVNAPNVFPYSPSIPVFKYANLNVVNWPRILPIVSIVKDPDAQSVRVVFIWTLLKK